MHTALAKFELRLWFRDYPFYLTTLLFFLYWFYFSVNFDHDPNFWGDNAEVNSNAPVVAYFLFSSLSFVTFFVAPLFSAAPALRDYDHHTWPYLLILPIDQKHRFWVRFVSGLVVNMLSAMLASSAILIAPLTTSPIENQHISDIPFAQVTLAWLILVFPNLFFTSAIVYALAIRFRRLWAAIAGTFVLVLGAVVSRHFGSSGGGYAFIFSDSTAFHIVHNITQYWTIEQRNSAFLPFNSALLANRLFWISIGLVALGLAFLWDKDADQKSQLNRPASLRSNWNALRSRLGNQGRHNDVCSSWLQRSLRRSYFGFRLFRWEFSCLVKDPFLSTVIGLSFGWALIQDAHVIDRPFEHVLPTTVLMVEAKRGLWMLTFLSIPFIVATSIFRERRFHVDHIVAALPVSTWSILFSKFASVVCYCLLFPTIVLVAGIATQSFHAHFHWDFSLYFFDLFGRYYPYLIRNVAIAFVLVGLFSTRLKGYAGAIALQYLCIFAHETGVWKHEFLSPLYLEKNKFSVFSGIAPDLTILAIRSTFWGSFVVLLLLVSQLIWLRGPSLLWKDRIARIPRRLTLGTSCIAVLATCGLIISTIANDRHFDPKSIPSDQKSHQKKHEEAEIPPFAPSLTMLHFDAEFDFDETEARITCKLETVLKNQSDQPITGLQIQLPESARSVSAQIGNFKSTPVSSTDPTLGLALFSFRPEFTIRPNQTQTVTLRYDLPWVNAHLGIAPPSAFLDQQSMLPDFGVDNSLEKAFANVAKTKQYRQPESLSSKYGFDALSWDIRVSIPSWATTWAPGASKVSESNSSKKKVRFDSLTPDRSHFVLGLSNYQSVHDRWTNSDLGSEMASVDIKVLAHPKHQQNSEAIIRSAKSILSALTQILGPYPYRDLRIVEVPEDLAVDSGLANLVLIPETEIWTGDYRKDQRPDRIDFHLARQIASHWWSNHFDAPNHPGLQVIRRGLPYYFAIRIIEEKYASDLFQSKYHSRLLHQYFWYHGIHGHTEPSLLTAKNNHYVHEIKAALVFRTMERLIGKPEQDTILANFHHQHALPDNSGSGGSLNTSISTDKGTLNSLYQQFLDISPTEKQGKVEELFGDRITYNLRLERAEAQHFSVQENTSPAQGQFNSGYQVTLTIAIQRLRSSDNGSVQSLPWRGELDFLITLRDLKHNKSINWPLSSNVSDGVQTIILNVPHFPVTATIDPRAYFIDSNRSDQTLAIKVRP